MTLKIFLALLAEKRAQHVEKGRNRAQQFLYCAPQQLIVLSIIFS